LLVLPGSLSGNEKFLYVHVSQLATGIAICENHKSHILVPEHHKLALKVTVVSTVFKNIAERGVFHGYSKAEM
jgi:hypothetical protein